MATGKAIKGLAGLKVTADNLDDLHKALDVLRGLEVLAGFPEETTLRTDDQSVNEPTNATLAYIHDNGDPAHNIPARPFMIPGMTETIPKVIPLLESAAQAALNTRNGSQVIKRLMRVGLAVQFGLRRKINEGIPPPLAEVTLRKRAAKGRKGAKKELLRRAQGDSPSTEFAKPLIDTGQLRNAVNFVIRKRPRR